MQTLCVLPQGKNIGKVKTLRLIESEGQAFLYEKTNIEPKGGRFNQSLNFFKYIFLSAHLIESVGYFVSIDY